MEIICGWHILYLQPPKRENWNGDIKGYMLQYRQFESEELFSIKITDVRNERHEQFVLQDLFKFTKYVITVQAFNEIGFGPRSDEVVARTQEDGTCLVDIYYISSLSIVIIANLIIRYVSYNLHLSI